MNKSQERPVQHEARSLRRGGENAARRAREKGEARRREVLIARSLLGALPVHQLRRERDQRSGIRIFLPELV